MLTSVDAAYKAEKAKALKELGTDPNSAEAKLYASALSTAGADASANAGLQKISDALSRLTYLVSVPFKGFEDLDKRMPWEMSSFPEHKIMKITKKNPKEMALYNSKLLSRIYPDGTRFSSTNYNPYYCWAVGCQMVALNYQTFGGPMWMNEAFFAAQARCGYILKPDWAMTQDPEKLLRVTNQYSELIVTVHSARQLPKIKEFGGSAVVHPYVVVHVQGHPTDETSEKTKVIKSNGYNPSWDEQFRFPLVSSATGSICFEILDSESKWRIAHYALMIESVRSGYHVVPLLDDFENEIPLCNLFCHFEFVELRK